MKKSTLIAFLLCLPCGLASAGAGYIITESGVPSRWDTSSAIIIHPESGACGTFSNDQMLAKINSNIGYWDDLAEVAVDFDVEGNVLEGVDGCNYGDYLLGVEGASNTSISVTNPILFDNDGEIVAAVAGTANKYRVLGFANPAVFTTDYAEIVGGQAVFNCVCLAGNEFGPCTVGQQTVEFSEDDLNFTMTHEMGHFLNLDHTQVNADLIDDGDASNDDFIPTMYPVSENAGEQISPIQDDISALASIYPSGSFASGHCRVTGSLLFAGGEQMRCADVQAINSSDRSKSVAFITGSYAPAVDNNGDGDTADDGECLSGCGNFEFYLDPDLSYTVRVTEVDPGFVGGSGISPCANGQLSNIETETLATISAADCTAGAAVSLGTITTTSAYSSSQTGGVSASLTSGEGIAPQMLFDDEGYGFAFEDDPGFAPPFLIGGSSVRPARVAASCPESDGSGGSGGSSSGGSSSGSSSSSSSASACSLNTQTETPSPSWELMIFAALIFAAFRGRKPRAG